MVYFNIGNHFGTKITIHVFGQVLTTVAAWPGPCDRKVWAACCCNSAVLGKALTAGAAVGLAGAGSSSVVGTGNTKPSQ